MAYLRKALWASVAARTHALFVPGMDVSIFDLPFRQVQHSLLRVSFDLSAFANELDSLNNNGCRFYT